MDHIPHPHIDKRRKYAEATGDKPSGFNNWLAVMITNVVGTMWCAYAFTIIALKLGGKLRSSFAIRY